MNRPCAELQAKLSVDGMNACILKGQGVAQLYGAPLRGLRQSGDIDVYVQGGQQTVMEWCRSIEPA